MISPPEYRRVRPESWLAAIWSLLVRIAATAAVAYVLVRVGFVIVVVLVAVMLAFTVAPVVDWLCRRRSLRWLPHPWRRSLATTVVFILLAAALVETGILIVKPMAAEVAAFAANWKSHQSDLSLRIERIQEWYNSLPDDVRQWVEGQNFKDLGARATEQLQHVARRTLESGMLLVELVLIPVLAFSFLTESRPLKREFFYFVPRSRLRDWLYVLRQAGIILQSYAIGQLILALIAGAVVWVLMVSLHIRYPLAMAVIAAVTRVIPVVGPVIGAVPIVLLATMQGWDRGVLVLAIFCIMHLVESKVVMPRLIGYRIKLHPAVVIVVLLVGAEFFGMWGMFLAAPVAAVVKVLLHHFLVRPRLHDAGAPRGRTGPPLPEEKPSERAAIAAVRRHSGAH